MLFFVFFFALFITIINNLKRKLLIESNKITYINIRQSVMANQLDIVNLIDKNPITRLTKDYQGKLINKIKASDYSGAFLN